MRPFLALALACAALVSPLAQSGAQLGRAYFANSGSPAAQADFQRGIAWLHSFGYEDAIDAFRAAQKVDPGFALAYWGEAMSFSQPLWFYEELPQGRAALAKLGATPGARLAKAKTPREQGFMRAVDALFGPGDQGARHKAYSSVMAKLAADYPADDEAQTFYALSLLAMLPRGDAALPLRRQAGAIAEKVFARSPRHPGAAHYILHAYDHGTLAGRALPAARAYAKIAPAASHALHMPAHTFLQVGLWDEAAESDEASWNASIAWAKRRGLPISSRDFHSLAWLQYEWTQQGRFSKTREAIAFVNEAMKAGVGSRESGVGVPLIQSPQHAGGHGYGEQSEIGRGSGLDALRNDRGSMRARYIIESERWSELKGQSTFDNIEELFAVGLSAVNLGDAARVQATIAEFRNASAPAQAAELREQAEVMLRQMEALDLFARGQHAAAFAMMDRAVALQARMPRPIGRPFPVKGADELYGELLFQVGRAKEAVVWFDRALARTPNRSRAVLGLARAYRNAGDSASARATYRRFLANWRLADPGLPEITEARDAVK
ncbi:MAG: bacterial transcriptional activator domain-containing protein [Acidobacteriota bacterium]|nr:bacterial transcriptional activator domain-containing protein [Acidobacteriota bacterium]